MTAFQGLILAIGERKKRYTQFTKEIKLSIIHFALLSPYDETLLQGEVTLAVETNT